MMLDFWFDFSSPYAYLASTRVDALAARTGATLRWRPMLLGAVFREVGQVQVPLLAASEAKQRHYGVDMLRWAAWWDAPFRFPSSFPIRSLLPLRTFLAHPDPIPFAHAVYRAAWAEDRDITDADVLRACGATEEALAAAPTMKQALLDHTTEAVAAGVFGAPTFIVDGKWLFWGQDRLDMVEQCLGGWVPPA
ncbi:MAG: 2-hydroxychromene-2-carboxylate isomerase [Pseudomonadota bacterium]|nr:2-hydroxychromene-2-carboxylate isomerase [Pseudomonadota bacterium]